MSHEPLLAQGQRVGGDFEIIRELGAGGMGAVYLARQSSTDALRALKVMRQRYRGDSEFERRFTQEARVGARIKSRHVIEVIAAGVDEALGMPWLAMEYLEGRTLDESMERFGVPSAGDANVLLEQLFHALAGAHDAQVVHRDLKPENVLLAHAETPGSPFTLKVLDFGIAKFLGAGDARVTSSLRTLLWGAPEQATLGSRIGPEADVWALGLLVFWLITGDTYWHAERELAAIFKEIAADPLSSATARARELAAPQPLPVAFDAWFARCVARDPSERFPHARDAWRELSVIALPWPADAPPWRGEQALELAATEAQLTPPQRSPAAARAALHSTEAAQMRTSTQPLTVTAPVSAEETKRGVSEASPHARAPARTRRSALLAAALAAPLAGGALAYSSLRSPQLGPAPLAASVSATLDPALTAPPPVDMRLVPKGTFLVGPWQNDLGEARLVPAGGNASHFSLENSFFIDTFEVDVAAYQKCVRAGRCVESASADPAFASLCNARDPAREHQPINCVARSQARAYCQWLGKRLPSEAEWERAARGDDARLYPWGNQRPATCEMAVVSPLCDRTPTQTRETGSRLAAALSPFGVADLAGNVWEWVEDGWSTEPAASAAPRSAPQSTPSEWGVLRGGSWDHEANHATAVTRLRAAVTRAEVSFGFRCARAVPRQ